MSVAGTRRDHRAIDLLERFGDLAAMVAAVFAAHCRRIAGQWWGPGPAPIKIVPRPFKRLGVARRAIAPVLLIFTFLVR